MAAKEVDHKKVKVRTLKERFEGKPAIGEVVSFNARPHAGNGHHNYADVVNSLKNAGLNHEVAREFTPEGAFARAARKLEEGGQIDRVTKEGGETVFQLTQKSLEEIKGEAELKFEAKTKLRLDHTTGKITCKIKELQNKAQQELDKAIDTRVTSDITEIIKKLFQGEDDPLCCLVPFGGSGRCFIVFKEKLDFVDKVERFLKLLGGDMERLPILETQESKERVAHEAANSVQDKINALMDKVKGFTVNTKGATLEKASQEIKKARYEIEALSMYLQDQSKECLKALQEADQELINQVKRITKTKEDTGSERTKVLGKYSITGIMRWCALEKWSETDVMKMFSVLGIEAAYSTIHAEMRDAAAGTRGKPAPVSKNDAIELYATLEDE